MFAPPKTLPTLETVKQYGAITSRMTSKYTRTTQKQWDSPSDDFIAWLEGESGQYAQKTWRLYRAALVHQLALIDPGTAKRICEIPHKGKPTKLRTSAQKKKSISDAEIIALTDFLLNEDRQSTPMSPISGLSEKTLHFLLSGVIAGLRPSEWFVTTMTRDGPKIVLRVKNGKASQGRALGEYRTLSLTLTGFEEKVVIEHYQEVKKLQSKEEFDRYYHACRDKLHDCTKKLWPAKQKRPTLYSGRHQFQANAKNDLPSHVIAALVGHATDRTTQEHYGRKQYGHPGRLRATPSAEDIQKVRVVPKNWSPPSIRKTITPKRD